MRNIPGRLNILNLSSCCLLATVLFVVQRSVGAYHLFYTDGRTIQTGVHECDALAPWESLPVKSGGDSIQPLTGLLSQSVAKGERIVRATPDADATNAQREELQSQKQAALAAIAKSLPGKTVTASFVVVDVLQRKNEDPDASILVIGRIDWSSDTVLTASDRKQIADVNNEANAQISKCRKVLATNHSSRTEADSIRKEIAKTEADRDRDITAIKDRAAAAKPSNIVFCLSNNQSLLGWKRGQHRVLKGAIWMGDLYEDSTRARVHYQAGKLDVGERESGDKLKGPLPQMVQEDNGAIYVGAEIALKVFDDEIGVDTGNDPSTTQPITEKSSSIASPPGQP